MPTSIRFQNRQILQLDDDMKQRISDFRFSERFPTEAAAIRELIVRGLTASKPKSKR